MTLTLRDPAFVGASGGGYDADAQAYITAVEAADAQSLETGVKDAINAFVTGCKTDGIWTAIKACCILAGARTLTGALTPLVGTAPTNNGPFVSGDYNRETGLLGNGSTKYLDSNRNNNADPQDNHHISVYVSTARTNASIYMGAEISQRNSIYATGGTIVIGGLRSNSTIDTGVAYTATGLVGASRTSSTNVNWRAGQTSGSGTNTSTTPDNLDIWVFCRNLSNAASSPTDARFAFYSIGESLDLALLDTRVTTLITDIGTAIP